MRYSNIHDLMDTGKPVSVTFTHEQGEYSDQLYCELVQKARFGEEFLIRHQRCRVCAYVFGDTEVSPEEYYYNSGRYSSREAARKAVSSLHRISKKMSILITPYIKSNFDVLLLFLKPKDAMRVIQAYSYKNGDFLEIKTGGIASVCSECTVSPLHGRVAVSLGCKGSRKHSRYSDHEVVVGIPSSMVKEIDRNLKKIPY